MHVAWATGTERLVPEMAAPIFQLHPADGPAPAEEPNEQDVLPSPSNPLPVARIVVDELTDPAGHVLLRKWRGEWWKYVGPHWVEVDPEKVRALLYERFEHSMYVKQRGDDAEMVPWAPDKAKVDKVLDAMTVPTLLDRDVDAPAWLPTGTSAAGYVPCQNGLVDVTTRRIVPTTPAYFGTVGIPLDYDPDAGEPTEWLSFLRSIWPTEDGSLAEEVRTLRQWFGYVLSGRLDLQKMLLMVGPPRCGKGTVARILQKLLGEANCSAPTLSGLSQNFGLETTIGKTLSVVGDARLGNNATETVVERLLSISGQDALTLDRKNKQAWTGTLSTRVMVMSNELPKFIDASGAIASRFVILRLEESFLGREDTGLEDRLVAELPQILKWALEGLEDLNAVGRLHETEAHREAMQDLYDLVSPISAFIRDVCVTGDSKASVPFAELYREYERWCDDHRRGAATGTAKFSEALKSRLPGVKTNYRPTVNGVKSPTAHVRGVTINPEWLTRPRGGHDPEDPFAPGKGWGRGSWT